MNHSPWWWKVLLSIFNPGGDSISISVPFGGGDGVEQERMMNFNTLKAACEFAVTNPQLVSRDITGDGVSETFCNRGLSEIATAMGFTGFRHLSANEQIVLMGSHPDWRIGSMDRAVAHALRGGLAVACLSANPHGHVCVVYPAQMEASSTWMEDVAMVANIGKKNGIMRLSGAFSVRDRPSVCFYLHGDV